MLKEKSEEVINKIASILKKPAQYDRSIHVVDEIIVYIDLTYGSLTRTLSIDVIVFNVKEKTELKIGFYSPNLKEKIEAAITLLQ